MNESDFRSRMRKAIGEPELPADLSAQSRLRLKHAPDGLANPHWITGIVAIVLAIAVIASLLAIGNFQRNHNQPANPVSKATPSASPPPSPPAPNTLGAVTDLALSPRALYVLYAPTGTQGALAGAATTMVARVDRQTGAVRLAGPFPGALRIAVVAGAVWIGSNELVELNADSLKELTRVALPAESAQRVPYVQLAASANELWAAYGRHLYQLDPATGRVLQTRSLPGLATSISLSPTGGQLYVGADVDPATTDTSATITAFDAATLNQTASTRTGGAGLGGPDVAAANDGVWVAYATGMQGQVEHRRASDLGESPVATHEYSNGVHVYVAGGFVWEADGMAGGLGCLDPQTGTLSWTTAAPLGGIVAGDNASIYLGGSNGVDTLTPGPGCKTAS